MSLADLKSQLAELTGEDSFSSAVDPHEDAPRTAGGPDISSRPRIQRKIVSDSERTNQLYDMAAQLKSKLEKQMSKKPDGCTFRPEVSERSKRLAVKKCDSGSSAFQRLYDNAEDHKKSLETLRSEANLREENTFVPKINADKSGSKKTAVPGARQSRFDRLYSDAVKHRDRLAAARKKIDAQVLPFKPKINGRSSARSQIPSVKQRHEMMYNPPGRKERREKREKEKLEKEKLVCTFKPNINRARPSSTGRERPGEGMAVFNRLTEAGKRTSERLAKLRAKKLKEDEWIASGRSSEAGDGEGENESGDGLTKGENGPILKNKKISKQELDQSIKRMSVDHLAKVADKLRKKKKEMDQIDGLTFRPKIHERPLSARRARPDEEPKTAIWERLHLQSQDLKKKLEKVKKEKADQEMEGCTFRPNLKKSSNRKVSRSRAPSPANSTPSSSTTASVVIESKSSSRGRAGRTTTSEGERTTKKEESNNRRSRSSSPFRNHSAINSSPSVPVWDRLANDKREIITLREEIKLQMEMSECQPYTKKPTSLTSKRNDDFLDDGDRTPIWERLMSQKKDTKALEQLREMTELKNCTFKPKTNWGKIVTVEETKSIWERLNETTIVAQNEEMLSAAKKMKAENEYGKRRKSVSPATADAYFQRLNQTKLGNLKPKVAAQQMDKREKQAPRRHSVSKTKMSSILDRLSNTKIGNMKQKKPIALNSSSYNESVVNGILNEETNAVDVVAKKPLNDSGKGAFKKRLSRGSVAV